MRISLLGINIRQNSHKLIISLVILICSIFLNQSIQVSKSLGVNHISFSNITRNQKILDNENIKDIDVTKTTKPLGGFLKIFSSIFQKNKNYLNTKNQFRCLKIPSNILKQKNFNLDNLSNEMKTDFFQKSKCNPVILIPGIFGSSLEFVLHNCKKFKEFHRNIMDSCGWDDCESPSFPKRFKIWLETGADKAIEKVINNYKGDFFSFLDIKQKTQDDKEEHEEDQSKKFYIPSMLKYFDIQGKRIYFNNKQNTEKCFGNIFRLYYIKASNNEYITETNDSNSETKNNHVDQKIKLQKKLKGAEIRILTENIKECGAEATSDYAKPYSQYLSKSLLGFKQINESLEKLGYIKGLSLFNIPYDFRLQINDIIPKIQETIKLAYKINKKKVIVIGHSYGGLLTYKLSTLKEKELIEHSIVIGAPLLGSFQAVKNVFGEPYNFGYEKTIEILGNEIGKIKTGLPLESMRIVTASLNLLQFFPKDIKNDETLKFIHKIKELKNSIIPSKSKDNEYKGNLKSQSQKSSKMSNKLDFLELIHLEDNKSKEILKNFYEVFPKPNQKCRSISNKKAGNTLTDESKLCKINYFDSIIQSSNENEYNSHLESKNFQNFKSSQEFKEKLNIEKDKLNDKTKNLQSNSNSFIQNNSININNKYNESKNEEKSKELKNLFLKSKNFREKFNLMNENIHPIFKIKYEDYIDYLISSHEITLFNNYPYPDVEFTFIYSNAFKTFAVKNIDLFDSNKEETNKTIEKIPGDQNIHAISSIYPGLNWLLSNFIDPSKYPYNKGIHFIEYCTEIQKEKQNKIFKKNFIHGKNQYLPLECECMSKGNEIDPEDCIHAPMINDKFLIKLLNDIITKGDKGKIYKAKDERFYELFLQKFNDEYFCENFRYLYKKKKA